MPIVKELVGNLISRALNAEFDVIAHCCNCFCKQRSGIAVEMVKFFQTDKFDLEKQEEEGLIDKLGRIDFERKPVYMKNKSIWVVNMYGQFHYQHPSRYGIPLDYDALRLCFRKLNYEFKEQSIGIPAIGSGLAKGDWNIIKQIINEETIDCRVAVVYQNAPY